MNRRPHNNWAEKFATARRYASGLGCVAVLLNVIAGPAIAGSFDGAMSNTKYVMMTGDFNNDGQNDVLMKAVPKIVMIPIDDYLDVPVAIPPPSPTFVLLSTGYGTYSLVTNPNVEMIGWAGWAPASQGSTYTGPNGQFAGSVTITAAAPDQASFAVSMAADTGLLQITNIIAPVVNNAPGGTGSSSSSTETYAYDSLGQLRMVTYPTGERVTYTYDESGNRTSSDTIEAVR